MIHRYVVFCFAYIYICAYVINMYGSVCFSRFPRSILGISPHALIWVYNVQWNGGELAVRWWFREWRSSCGYCSPSMSYTYTSNQWPACCSSIHGWSSSSVPTMRGASLLGWQVSARHRRRERFYGVPDPLWSSCRAIYHAPLGRLKWLSRPLPLMARRQLVEELIWKKVRNIPKNSVWVQLTFGRCVGLAAIQILAKLKSRMFGVISQSPKIGGTMQTLQRWCSISPWASYLGVATWTTGICWI